MEEDDEVRRIFEEVKMVDWGFSGNENYKKGLVFSLLRVLKAGSKGKFLCELERLINARNIGPVKSDRILNPLIISEGSEFSSRSYAVVAGILASQSQKK